MNNLIKINYLTKQQEMEEASKVMEHSLKTIANLFKNFQADYLSLLEKNKELEKSMNKLQNKNNIYCCTCEKDSIQKENTSTNHDKHIIIQDEINKNIPKIINDVETQGIIESTQIEEPILNKLKNRHVNKKSNLQINIIHKNRKAKHEHNKIGCATSSNTLRSSRNNKELNPCKVRTEIIISTESKLSQQCERVLDPMETKTIDNDAKDCQINNAFDSEYSGIDATLFEQPFSQEESANSEAAQTPCKLNDVTIVTDDCDDTSPKINFSQEDVVETSPKKNIIRRRNFLRSNKTNIKSASKAKRDIKTLSNADDKGQNLSTQKSLKSYFTANENDEKTNSDIINEETSRTQNRKINIFSQRAANTKESDVLINESTILSSNSRAILPILNVPSSQENEENNIHTIANTSKETQSINKNSDETYFTGDETYFPGYEVSRYASVRKNPKGILNKAKRKLSDIANSPNIEAHETSMPNVMELDIGDMSDWETDVAGDESPSFIGQQPVKINSFDIVPVKKVEKPKFATKGPIVRKKTLRAKLRGWDCENCANYYENMGLSEKELQERKDQCSRHRSNFNERYYTPPGLWDLRFPDTQNSSQE